ncbi:MFS transporter [Dactylosporangium vinaceum]|uniref:MFS transporter n=1 Tax=Dactylosporangium vinaceum TaxID=53362 RepID=A0ABV5M9Y5_9ACTN|nr:MFS transporter [Dactylosporangium vinaceum]
MSGTDERGAESATIPAPGGAPRGSLAAWALVIVAAAQLMTVLDLAIVYVALPSIQADLGISTPNRQWVVSAYAIAFGGLLLLGGRLVDYFGRRRMFVAALVGFAVAAGVGGIAPTQEVLFGARAVQGAFGAVITPAVLSLVSVTFTEKAERTRAFAVYGMVSGSGAAIGLILGGVLTQYGSWRWCLLVNVPFALLIALAAVLVLPKDEPIVATRYDIPGAIAATIGIAGLAEGFTLAGSHGWGSPYTVGTLVGAVLFVAAFLAIEARSAAPLLPLRIVTEYHRALLYAAAFLANAAQLSMFLFLTYYFQTTLDYSAVRTGFAFLPFALAVVLTGNLLGAPLARVNPLNLMMVGAAACVLALLALSRLNATTSYPIGVMLPEILMGFGVALSLFPLNNVVLAGIDPADAGVASAAVSTTQQMGAALGNASLNTVFALGVAHFLARPGNADRVDDAAVHGYSLVFRWESGLYLAFLLLVLLVWRDSRRRIQAA